MVVVGGSDLLYMDPSSLYLDHLEYISYKITLINAILTLSKGESALRYEHRRFYGPSIRVAPITSVLISLVRIVS